VKKEKIKTTSVLHPSPVERGQGER